MGSQWIMLKSALKTNYRDLVRNKREKRKMQRQARKANR